MREDAGRRVIDLLIDLKTGGSLSEEFQKSVCSANRHADACRVADGVSPVPPWQGTRGVSTER